jgi:Flp pilus assembly protein TadG
MPIVLVGLVALLAASALAVDAGLLWTSRTQLQGAVDAAALAAAASLIDPSVPAVTADEARNAADAVAAGNAAAPVSSVTLTDVQLGAWDTVARIFDDSVDLTDPKLVNAVNVTAHLDGNLNQAVPAFLSRVLGHAAFSVSAQATAYLGFALTFPPGTVHLPITIDCCDLGGSSCDGDYCATVTNTPPHPCSLEDGTQVSCLEFHPTSEQNACWTEFDGQSPAINTPGMIDIIRNSNERTVGDEPVYVDNGTKTPVVDIIYEKFHRTGEFAGSDPQDPNAGGTDLDGDGYSDTWVVGLPVVQCQDPGANCASGTPQQIVGAVCFDINEVLVNPKKIIKGRFLCPNDERYRDDCGSGSGPGGGDFGVRAEQPVLVQ